MHLEVSLNDDFVLNINRKGHKLRSCMNLAAETVHFKARGHVRYLTPEGAKSRDVCFAN